MTTLTSATSSSLKRSAAQGSRSDDRSRHHGAERNPHPRSPPLRPKASTDNVTADDILRVAHKTTVHAPISGEPPKKKGPGRGDSTGVPMASASTTPHDLYRHDSAYSSIHPPPAPPANMPSTSKFTSLPPPPVPPNIPSSNGLPRAPTPPMIQDGSFSRVLSAKQNTITSPATPSSAKSIVMEEQELSNRKRLYEENERLRAGKKAKQDREKEQQMKIETRREITEEELMRGLDQSASMLSKLQPAANKDIPVRENNPPTSAQTETARSSNEALSNGGPLQQKQTVRQLPFEFLLKASAPSTSAGSSTPPVTPKPKTPSATTSTPMNDFLKAPPKMPVLEAPPLKHFAPPVSSIPKSLSRGASGQTETVKVAVASAYESPKQPAVSMEAVNVSAESSVPGKQRLSIAEVRSSRAPNGQENLSKSILNEVKHNGISNGVAKIAEPVSAAAPETVTKSATANTSVGKSSKSKEVELRRSSSKPDRRSEPPVDPHPSNGAAAPLSERLEEFRKNKRNTTASTNSSDMMLLARFSGAPLIATDNSEDDGHDEYESEKSKEVKDVDQKEHAGESAAMEILSPVSTVESMSNGNDEEPIASVALDPVMECVENNISEQNAIADDESTNMQEVVPKPEATTLVKEDSTSAPETVESEVAATDSIGKATGFIYETMDPMDEEYIDVVTVDEDVETEPVVQNELTSTYPQESFVQHINTAVSQQVVVEPVKAEPVEPVVEETKTEAGRETTPISASAGSTVNNDNSASSTLKVQKPRIVTKAALKAPPTPKKQPKEKKSKKKKPSKSVEPSIDAAPVLTPLALPRSELQEEALSQHRSVSALCKVEEQETSRQSTPPASSDSCRPVRERSLQEQREFEFANAIRSVKPEVEKAKTSASQVTEPIVSSEGGTSPLLPFGDLSPDRNFSTPSLPLSEAIHLPGIHYQSVSEENKAILGEELAQQLEDSRQRVAMEVKEGSLEQSLANHILLRRRLGTRDVRAKPFQLNSLHRSVARETPAKEGVHISGVMMPPSASRVFSNYSRNVSLHRDSNAGISSIDDVSRRMYKSSSRIKREELMGGSFKREASVASDIESISVSRFRIENGLKRHNIDEQMHHDIERLRLRAGRASCVDHFIHKRLNNNLKRLTKMYDLPKMSSRFRKFVNIKNHGNGGATILSCDYNAISSNFNRNDTIAFFRQFNRLGTSENNGSAIFAICIVENGAKTYSDQLRMMVEQQPGMKVKVGSLTNKQLIETMTISNYYQHAMESLDSGTLRCGNMHEVSLVGTKSEEVGGYCRDVLAKLSYHPFLNPVLPWGDFSHLKNMKPNESDDGPIFWVRPGEQMVPTSSDARRGAHEPRHPNATRVTERREVEFLDRTLPHADQVTDPDATRTSAAVGVVQAVRPNKDDEEQPTEITPQERSILKEVVVFSADYFTRVSEYLNLDLYEPPISQCTTWVDDARLNSMRREGIRYAKLELRDNDMYMIPRSVIHQFRTLNACSSFAWHVRLSHYYKKKKNGTDALQTSVDDADYECVSDYSDGDN